MSDDKNSECLKALIEWAYQDAKQVLLLVVFELSALTVIVSSKFFGAEWRLTLPIACISTMILTSAGLYMWYIHETYMGAAQLIDCMHDDDYLKGKAIMDRVWKKNMYYYFSGHALGLTALISLLVYGFTLLSKIAF